MENTRKHHRREIDHPVRARCATWDQFLTLHTRNISPGGMFLAVDDPPPVGTRLELRFDLPNGQVLALGAHVVHVVPPEDDAQTTGFGLELDALTLDEEGALEELVMLAERHVASPPPPLPSRDATSDGKGAS